MIEQAQKGIQAVFPLKRLDAGEYAAFKAAPLNVKLDWYEAEGLGNVSVIHGKAMGGLMRMDTMVINATLRDAPLFSYDYICALGKHTMLVEVYDTLLCPEGFDGSSLNAVKESVASLPDHDLGAHWYDGMKMPASFAKRTGKAALPMLNDAFLRALDAYLAAAKACPPLDDASVKAKQQKAAAYVDGLLEKGGPSTDAFTKAIGAARTRDLFTRIVFGTEV